MNIPAFLKSCILKFKFKNSFQISNFKFQIVIFSFLFIFLFAIRPAFAQTSNQYNTPNINPDVPKNLHTWTQTVMIEVMSSMTCQLTGIDPVSPNQKCLGVDSKTGKIGFVENGGGAIGMMGNMIAVLYQPPIHTSDYFNYLAQNFGIVKPTYAQANGIGFEGISPLIKVWTVFRNIVYLFFVLVFMVIGIAVMLRVKIDPRTVMSIENQIPKIIIGLLVVTFSFAIAGFLIDIMYVLIYLIFNLFSAPGLITDPMKSQKMLTDIAHTQQIYNSSTSLGVFNTLVGFTDTVTNVSGSVKDLVTNLFSPTISGGGLLDWGGIIVGRILGGIVGILALLIIAIAILFSMFRLWFSLIMAYVFILMDIALAPIWIIAGLVPGSSIGFSAWLRDMLANLLVFPTVIAFFLFARVMMESFNSPGSGSLFVPPLIGNPNNADGTSPIGSIIALASILITPTLLDGLKAALKAPKIDLSYVGKAIGVGPAVAGSVAHNVVSPYGALQNLDRFLGGVKGAGGGGGFGGFLKGLKGGGNVLPDPGQGSKSGSP
ncbi:MAG: hypothetical protein Q8P80_02030 [Candidatus Levybacteria bacterium]|nr:hypothetical protein [Candidatus Levybacteria bacterium]